MPRLVRLAAAVALTAAGLLAVSPRLWGRVQSEHAAAPAARAAERTVVLELFTSEGCSSCPPADRLLEELTDPALTGGVAVLPLSLHVDYWNHLGWRDPYSQAAFSRRQEHYAEVLPEGRVYTPQLVVDGEVHLVGSHRQQAQAAIAAAGHRAKAAVGLRPALAVEARPDAAEWEVSIDVAPLEPRPSSVELFVAVTEDGLESSVARGENAGRRLRHLAVVRRLRALGKVRPGAAGSATSAVTIDLDSSWRRDRLHLVAWIAGGPSGRILGAARARLG